jgi:uncharacterized membrane protein
MIPANLHHFPLDWRFLVILAALLGASATITRVGALQFTSSSMGISARTLLVLLVLVLVGSYINIPVAYLPERAGPGPAVVSYYGMRYLIPIARRWSGTIIAVNVGGAVIPALLALYLLMKYQLYLRGLAGVAMVATVCNLIARPMHGLGLAEPIFITPLITAFAAAALSLRYAAPLAFISGSLGTLIGGDLLNLDKVRALGAPIASIGGAGTFDGIFVTGVLALLYAGFGVHLLCKPAVLARDQTSSPS